MNLVPKSDIFNIIHENSLNIPIKEVNLKNKKIHIKYSFDNILRKIQFHYMSFIVSFLNDILRNFNINQRFLRLDFKYCLNIKKDFIKSLKKKTLSEIICNNISSYLHKKKIIIKNYMKK